MHMCARPLPTTVCVRSPVMCACAGMLLMWLLEKLSEAIMRLAECGGRGRGRRVRSAGEVTDVGFGREEGPMEEEGSEGGEGGKLGRLSCLDGRQESLVAPSYVLIEVRVCARSWVMEHQRPRV